MVGGHGHGHGVWTTALHLPARAHRGRPRHADGLVRQPWYPVQERYGLIFAYMGPPERKPVLPRYEALDVLDTGEFIDADDTRNGGNTSV